MYSAISLPPRTSLFQFFNMIILHNEKFTSLYRQFSYRLQTDYTTE